MNMTAEQIDSWPELRRSWRRLRIAWHEYRLASHRNSVIDLLPPEEVLRRFWVFRETSAEAMPAPDMAAEVDKSVKEDLAAMVISYRTQALTLAAQLAERNQLLRDVLSDTIGGKVGAGDGNTYVTRPISGKTHNAIVQALAGAK